MISTNEPTSFINSDDRIGRECWNFRCSGDTGEICDWCGLHNGLPQICCNGRGDYTMNHANCNGAEYTNNIWGHQCVVLPTQDQEGSEISRDESSDNRKCGSSGS